MKKEGEGYWSRVTPYDTRPFWCTEYVRRDLTYGRRKFRARDRAEAISTAMHLAPEGVCFTIEEV